MRFLLISSLALGGAFLFPSYVRGNQQFSAHLVAEDNVNSRYTVESVEVSGQSPPELPPTLRERVSRLIGARFDPAQFDELAREIRKELRLRSVKPQVLRGSAPNLVRVRLETERRSVTFDVSVPKFLYHSRQGWSTQVQASTTIARDHVLRFGVSSDGDELTERFAGFAGAYENLHTGSSRVRTGFIVEEFHEQWNRATVQADGVRESDLYRARRNLQPQAVFILMRPLTLTLGASFEQLQMQSPESPSRAANSIIAALSFHKRLEGSGEGEREMAFNYGLRLATKAIGSDYSYTRHRVSARYAATFGRSTLSDEALAGSIAGNAPLFERFVVGTSSLLRGWNRYEIDPLGGNRIVHNTVDYSFQLNPGGFSSSRLNPGGTVQVFYDAGALWNQGQAAPLRHSLGFGYRRNVFSVALAFPVRDGRIDPVFMVGMNY